MKTPIYDFLQKYADSNIMRLHMPGHKGKMFCDPLATIYPYDITEIKGADSLFEANGIIKESEENASKLFNTIQTVYSTQGSTLCIQTMLVLAAKPRSTVIAARNAHKAFLNTCVLLDLDVSWIYPKSADCEETIVSYNYTVEDIEKAILAAENPSCVYITSPDYYGRMADISAISVLCRKYNMPLLVDNAHGAHLAFLEESQHPIALGADMCCDSAHKMLPVLTGGAYLHIGNERFSHNIKDTMSLFSSTSPSYLTMCSLDLCNNYLESEVKNHLSDAISCLNSVKERLSEVYNFVDSEPLRMTISTRPNGLTGYELAKILRIHRIECEYADDGYVVLLFSPLNSYEEFEMVYTVLSKIKTSKLKLETKHFELPKPQIVMSIRAASLAENEEIPVDESLGRICGKTKVTCPPGIAIVASGEKIDVNCINILKKYSIFKINVVK